MLRRDSENTPLQLKLNDLAEVIVKIVVDPPCSALSPNPPSGVSFLGLLQHFATFALIGGKCAQDARKATGRTVHGERRCEHIVVSYNTILEWY